MSDIIESVQFHRMHIVPGGYDDAPGSQAPRLEAANRFEQTTTQGETKRSCRKTHDNEEGIVETDRQPHHHP